jgi:antitoxin VapB
MSRSKPELTEEQLKEYDRQMLRASFVSLFWSVISDLKKRRGYKLQHLADKLGCDKSTISRWFAGNSPNWTLNTISDLAYALNVDLRIEAVDRETNTVHTPQGPSVDIEITSQTTPTGQLTRLLALKSGRTPGEVVREAIEAKAREAGVLPSESLQRRKPDLQKLLEISDRAAALPVLDPREADEIIGYDEHGLPR